MHPGIHRPIQIRLLGEFDVAVKDQSQKALLHYAKASLLLGVLALAQGQPISRHDLATMLWPDIQQDGRANLRHALYHLRKVFQQCPHVLISTRHSLALKAEWVLVDVLAITGAYPQLSASQRLQYDHGVLFEYLPLPASQAFKQWFNKWQLKLKDQISLNYSQLMQQYLESQQTERALKLAKHWLDKYPQHSLAQDYLNQLQSTPSHELKPRAVKAVQPQELNLISCHSICALGLVLALPNDHEDGLLQQRLVQADQQITALAAQAGALVISSQSGSYVLLLGFDQVLEKPAQLGIQLAMDLMALQLDSDLSPCMGLHVDYATIQPHTSAQTQVHALRHHALKLAYGATPKQILASSSAIARLHADYLSQELKPNVYAIESPKSHATNQRMFGRAREFEALIRHLAGLQHGQTATSVVLFADVGMGKSLMLNALAEYARISSCEVRFSRCRQGQSTPLDLHPQPNLVPGASGYMPLVIIIDNWHWADNSSKKQLNKFLQQQHARPTLVLVSTAADEVPSQFSNRLQLQALEAKDMGELINTLSHTIKLSNPQKQRMIEWAQGTPLFILELVRQHQFDPAAQVESTYSPPPLIIDRYLAKLAKLSAYEREFLQIVAVVEHLNPDVYKAVAKRLSLSPAKLNSALARLRAQVWLSSSWPVVFTNNLARHCVYLSYPISARKHTHAFYASYLIQHDKHLPAHIAHHLHLAQHADASSWWCNSARQALNHSAINQALDYALKAKAALAFINEPNTRHKQEVESELVLGAVHILQKGGGASETEATFAQLAQLTEQSPIGLQQRFESLFGTWVVSFNSLPHTQALVLATQLMDVAQSINHLKTQSHFLKAAQFALGQTHLFMGDVLVAQRHLEASAHNPDSPNNSTYLTAQGALSWIHTLQGNDDQALITLNGILQRGLAEGLHTTHIPCLISLCEIYRLKQDIPKLLATADLLEELANKNKLTFWQAWPAALKGWGLAMNGQPTGIKAIQQACSIALHSMPHWQTINQLLLADALNALSESQAALEAASKAEELKEHFGSKLFSHACMFHKGVALAGLGKSEPAIEILHQCVAESRRIGVFLHSKRAQAVLVRLQK